jgi:hypothetical protein
MKNLLEAREWLRECLKAAGADTDHGCGITYERTGPAEADIDVEIDGQLFNVSIRFIEGGAQ